MHERCLVCDLPRAEHPDGWCDAATHIDELRAFGGVLDPTSAAYTHLVAEIATDLEPLYVWRDPAFAETSCHRLVRHVIDAVRDRADAAADRAKVVSAASAAPTCRKCGEPVTPGYRWHAWCLGTKGASIPAASDETRREEGNDA